MQINIAVVSHGHSELIQELDCLPKLAMSNEINVCVLDNIGEEGFKPWCNQHDIAYLENITKKGFGENNNLIYSFYAKKHVEAKRKFLVMNPDVQVDVDAILDLLEITNQENAKISTLNLFKDYALQISDDGVRKFPTGFNYFQSILLNKNDSIIDKSAISRPTYVDWAAGSFLLFDFDYFGQLGGFDQKYHLYCEDVDICHRSYSLYNERVLFCPSIKAVHLAQHASRSIFSKHIFWHLSSMGRYLLRKRNFTKQNGTH